MKNAFALLTAISGIISVDSLLAQPIAVPQPAPYSNDAHTLLLEHFDGTTSGVTNGSISYRSGVFGQGAHLDDNSWISWTLGALPQGTIEFWANLDTLTNGASGGFLSLATSAFGQFDAQTMLVEVPFAESGEAPYKPVGHLHNGVTWYVTPSGTNLPNSAIVGARQWHHYAFSWGTNGLNLYLDGLLISSNATALAQNPGTGWWAIGCGLTATARIQDGGFNGLIDELRVSNIQRTFSRGPSVTFVKAFTVDYSSLTIGSNYQLQASADLNTWTNFGTAFVATSANFTNASYKRIDSWNGLFFRLLSLP